MQTGKQTYTQLYPTVEDTTYLRNGVTHSRMGPLTSMNNQDHLPQPTGQYVLGSSSIGTTLACNKLTFNVNHS